MSPEDFDSIEEHRPGVWVLGAVVVLVGTVFAGIVGLVLSVRWLVETIGR